jgi:hypothetical protein
MPCRSPLRDFPVVEVTERDDRPAGSYPTSGLPCVKPGVTGVGRDCCLSSKAVSSAPLAVCRILPRAGESLRRNVI